MKTKNVFYREPVDETLPKIEEAIKAAKTLYLFGCCPLCLYILLTRRLQLKRSKRQIDDMLNWEFKPTPKIAWYKSIQERIKTWKKKQKIIY